MAADDRDGPGQERQLSTASDTIYALSSGSPPAAIAVIRISGAGSHQVLTRLASFMPPLRQAVVRTLRDDEGGVLDQALVLAFAGPASATGEDLVELHCHGGRAVVDAVQDQLRSMGLRHAEAGEFTRRALTNGVIDLAQAEGLADLLAAETDMQRRLAIGALEGRLSAVVRGWLDALAMLSARTEAMIDFEDEDDVPVDSVASAAVRDDVASLCAEIQALLDVPPVERVRDGIRVALAGPPNSGKSTLLNLLVGRDAALVSPVSGTTRDVIEAPVRRSGVAYVVIDTAGLHDASGDSIEIAGIARARDTIATADIVLWLGDVPPPSPAMVWLHARADLPERSAAPGSAALVVRRDRQQTIDALWMHVEALASNLIPAGYIALHDRERRVCVQVLATLRGMPDDPVLVAERLRQAVSGLATLLGVNATEAMLDALFGRFCIGK